MKDDGADGPELPVIPEETYTDRSEYARGGLGRVVRATDRSMGRIVAIKELLPGTDLDEARFIREALVTGRLEHPSIVPVYEAGRWPSGKPFYTMKLVSGRSLRDVVRETKTLEQRLALVPKVVAVAEAIAYAHSRHVIHRDIKPSNVIVGQYGETIVIDWGLAKELGSIEEHTISTELRGPIAAELTSIGDVLGTPAYMAPEQAHGDPVDERADVYALGALLYFVLSGSAPHEPTQVASGRRALAEAPTEGRVGPAEDETGTDLVAVARRKPVPLEERRPGVPRELYTIVGKAMARTPGERYPTAKEFAEDLAAFQTGRLVSAHRYSPFALVRRWVSRNRVPVSVGAIAVAILVAGGVLSVRRIIAARDVAVSARSAERDARQQAERRAHELILLQARASLPRDPTAALAWLRTYPTAAPGWDGARALIAEALAAGVARDVWRIAEGGVAAVRLAGDGRTLVAVGGDGVARVLDPDSRVWRVLGDVGTSGGGLAVSPDGKTVAAGGDDRAIRLFPIGGGEPRVLGAHDDSVESVAFSPDGTLVASTSVDRTVRVWPVAGGEPRVLRGHELATVGVAFSPDGTRLATGSEDATLRIWDVATGEPRGVYRADRSVLDVVWSPDGRRVAASTRAGSRVWELGDPGGPSGTGRQLGDRSDEVYGVDWAPNGTLVTAGVDGLGVWDRSLQSVARLVGHEGSVATVSLARDGGSVVSGGSDGTIRVWTLRPQAGEVLREGNQPAGTGARPRVSPDGRLLVAPGEDGTILVVRGKERSLLTGHTGAVREIAFSPDGATLYSYGLDRTVRAWDPARGTGKVLIELPGQAFRLRVAPDGRHLGWTQGFEELDVFNLREGAIRCVFRGRNDSASSFSFDGKTIVYADGYDVVAGDVDACTSRKVASHRGSIFNFSWRRDGTRVLSASADGTVGIIDPTGATPARFVRAHEKAVYAVAWAPDGASFASVGFDSVARTWDATGAPRLTLRGHEKLLLYVAYSPDGALLATAGADDSVRIWDAVTGDLVQREADTGHGGIAIAPDGAWIASAGPHGVRRWPLDRRDALPRDPAALITAIDTATRARIDDSGRLDSGGN